ncbi:MAG TPA: hypothetical protein VM912_10250 [Terriglobales bacterium]|nr:hypothetical protein [Terriglobales bacterium]
MRRLVANSVLLVMLGLFFAPAIAIAAPAPVPMCCRRGGAHHCSAASEVMGTSANGFRANHACPFQQGSQLGSSKVALPLAQAAAMDLCRQLVVGNAVSQRHFTASYSDYQRGPPALL